MTTINLHEAKADYFEKMSQDLFVASLLRRIYLGDLMVEEYNIDIIKEGVREAQNQMQKCIRESQENLSVFSGGFINQSLDMEHIEDPDNMIILGNANLAFSEIHRLLSKGKETNKSEYELWNIEQELIERSNRVLGYWAAKAEDYGPVLEASIKRRQKTQKKFEDFVKVCVKHKIYSAEDFKGDRSKRQEFFDEVKGKLDLFSERRVLDYLKDFQEKLAKGEIIRVPTNGEINIKSREEA